MLHENEKGEGRHGGLHVLLVTLTLAALTPACSRTLDDGDAGLTDAAADSARPDQAADTQAGGSDAKTDLPARPDGPGIRDTASLSDKAKKPDAQGALEAGVSDINLSGDWSQGQTCTSSPCQLLCPWGGCSQNCASAASCTMRCKAGKCKNDCGKSSTCVTYCEQGYCDVECRSASCTVYCKGGYCSLDCTKAAKCSLACPPGKGCKIKK